MQVKGDQYKTYISNHFKPLFPDLYITTWEEERVLSAVQAVCEGQTLIEASKTVFTWRSTTGIGGDGQSEKGRARTLLKALEFVRAHARWKIR